jgi:hypothetical protein
MACAIHDRPAPCPQCEWAASSDPVLVLSAQARADRVAGRDHSADGGKMVAIQTTPEAKNTAFPIATSENRSQSVAMGPPVDWSQCPARYKAAG